MLEVIGVVDSEDVDAFALAATRPAFETEPAVLQASVAPGNRIPLDTQRLRHFSNAADTLNLFSMKLRQCKIGRP